jgi:hypothetical protein
MSIDDLLHWFGEAVARMECTYTFPVLDESLPKADHSATDDATLVMRSGLTSASAQGPEKTPLQDLAWEHMILAVKGDQHSPKLHVGRDHGNRKLTHYWSKADSSLMNGSRRTPTLGLAGEDEERRKKAARKEVSVAYDLRDETYTILPSL